MALLQSFVAHSQVIDAERLQRVIKPHSQIAVSIEGSRHQCWISVSRSENRNATRFAVTCRSTVCVSQRCGTVPLLPVTGNVVAIVFLLEWACTSPHFEKDKECYQ